MKNILNILIILIGFSGNVWAQDITQRVRLPIKEISSEISKMDKQGGQVLLECVTQDNFKIPDGTPDEVVEELFQSCFEGTGIDILYMYYYPYGNNYNFLLVINVPPFGKGRKTIIFEDIYGRDELMTIIQGEPYREPEGVYQFLFPYNPVSHEEVIIPGDSILMILSNSKVGRSYTLYRHWGVSRELEVLPGTGDMLVFGYQSLPGDYYVLDSRYIEMENRLTLRLPWVVGYYFERITILENNVTQFGGTMKYSFDIPVEKNHLWEEVEKWCAFYGTEWDNSRDNIVRAYCTRSASEGIIELVFGPNLTDSPIVLYTNMYNNHVVENGPTPGQLHDEVTQPGGGYIPEVLLQSYSADEVNYSFYIDSGLHNVEYILMKGNKEVDRIVYAEKNIERRYFDHSGITGIYTLKARYKGYEKRFGKTIVLGSEIDDQQNYILEIDYYNENEFTEKISYYNGLGQLGQIVDFAASPVGGSILHGFEYDIMGRSDAETFLPMAGDDDFRAYIPNFREFQDYYFRQNFSDDPDRDYVSKKIIYEDIPENRPISIGGYGENYQVGASGHYLSVTYRLNSQSDRIKKFRFDPVDNSLIYEGYFSPGTLKVREAGLANTAAKTDTLYFSDSFDNTVAMQYRLSDGTWRTSLTVYDRQGQIRYIIPPIAEKSMYSQGAKYNLDNGLRDYCLYFEYDKQGNLIYQYIPGRGFTENIYDKKDQLVMYRDQVMIDNDQWFYIKYDFMSRPILTGVISGGTYDDHKSQFETADICHEQIGIGNVIFGYSNQCHPVHIDSTSALTVYYYDDYWWTDIEFDNSLMPDPSVTADNYPAGKTTGKITKIIGPDVDTWLSNVNFYDKKGNKIQTYEQLYPEGMEIISSIYNYTGDVTAQNVRQTVGGNTISYSRSFSYDSHGRILNIEQEIAGDTRNGKVRISDIGYDPLGRNNTKALHNGISSLTYRTNIEGKVMGMESEKFSYDIAYDRPVMDDSEPRFDGLISESTWERNGVSAQGYSYSYDADNRLEDGKTSEKSNGQWQSTQKYSESEISYDDNGNIRTLKRYDANGEVLHDIVYKYESTSNRNALTSVIVNGNPSQPFRYDSMGNLLYDGYFDTSIEYTIHNLPSKISSGRDVVKYYYKSTGEKIAVNVNGAVTHYRNSMVYGAAPSGAEELIYILHPEGLVTAGEGNYIYKYFLTDHTGSVRSVIVPNPDLTVTVVQATDYYPYGCSWEFSDLHENKYLFSGKELQDYTIGSNDIQATYDFVARHYNPFYGRWLTTDRTLQDANPYVYCGNSPVVYFDPDGEQYYIMDNMGYITPTSLGLKDNRDVLFAGSLTGPSIVIYDQNLLKNLVNTEKKQRIDASTTYNKEDAFNLYHFASNNTIVEWAIAGFMDVNRMTEWGVWTSHKEGSVAIPERAFPRKNILDMIYYAHSHPTSSGKGASGYRQNDMTGDFYNMRDRFRTFQRDGMTDINTWYKSNDGVWRIFPKHYIYEKTTSHMYYYDMNRGDYFIRNINKYSDLYRNLGF